MLCSRVILARLLLAERWHAMQYFQQPVLGSRGGLGGGWGGSRLWLGEGMVGVGRGNIPQVEGQGMCFPLSAHQAEMTEG